MKRKLLWLILLAGSVLAPSANARCVFQYKECAYFFDNCGVCADLVYVYNCDGRIDYFWEGCCICT